MEDYPSARDCEHGQLRRACPICDAERRLAELQEAVRKYRDISYERDFALMRGKLVSKAKLNELFAARAAVDALVGEG